VPNDAANAPAHLKTDLGKLGGFARTGLPGDDHDLMVFDGGGQFTAELADRKIRVGDLRYRSQPGSHNGLGRSELPDKILKLRGTNGGAQRVQSPTEPGGVADGEAVKSPTQCAHIGNSGLGHLTNDRRRSRAAEPPVRRINSEKGCPTMTYVIVGGLALVGVGLVASQLFRLKDWLNRQPIPEPTDPDQPEDSGGGSHP
jgi:hypothetical protein